MCKPGLVEGFSSKGPSLDVSTCTIRGGRTALRGEAKPELFSVCKRIARLRDFDQK